MHYVMSGAEKFPRPMGKSFTTPYFGSNEILRMKEALADNPDETLLVARRLCETLLGRTVITSDRGEAFGERLHRIISMEIHGHRDGIKIDALMRFPWFMCKQS